MRATDTRLNLADILLTSFGGALWVLFSLAGILGYVTYRHLLWLAPVGSGIIGAFLMYLRISENDARFWAIYEASCPQPEIVTETVTERVYITPDKNYVKIGNQWIYQPAPGVISQMLRHAASPETRRHFSWRIARQHGYTEREYDAAVNQLKAVGWMTDELRNSAPMLDKDKLVEIHDWLNSPHPPTAPRSGV